METPSEENQDQRQNKRGTNERSQRATSFHCCVYWGFNLLQPAWVDPMQQTDRFLKIKLSIFASAIACAEMLKIQLQMSPSSFHIVFFFICLFKSPHPPVFCLCSFCNLISLSTGWMFQQSSLLQQERCRVAAGRHQATVTFKDNEPVSTVSTADQSNLRVHRSSLSEGHR